MEVPKPALDAFEEDDYSESEDSEEEVGIKPRPPQKKYQLLF